MDFMTWSQALETGIEIVDDQHRGLVELVNSAAPLLTRAGGADPAQVMPILQRLTDYAVVHFRTEEELMAQAGLDSRVVSRHQVSHARFARRVAALVRVATRGSALVGEELLSFLAGWLLYHILGEDQTMARQLRAKADGADAQTAYREAEGARTTPDPRVLSHAVVGLYASGARSQQTLEDQAHVLAAIAQLQALFIDHGEERALFEAALDALLNLTESRFGFIAELRTDPQGRRYQQCLAISNLAWDDATRRFYDEQAPAGFCFYAFDGLNSAAINAGCPVIANQPAEDPRHNGRLPPGHPPLESFLGLPLMFGGTLVGSIGLANRFGGYQESQAEALRPIIDTCAQILTAMNYRRRGQDSERALREGEARYRALVEQSGVVHWEYDIVGDRFTYVSPNAAALLGRPPGDWTDLASWAAMVHPDDRPAAMAYAEAETQAGRAHAKDYRLMAADGRAVPVRDVVTLTTGEDGHPTRLAGVITDLSVVHETLSRLEHLTHYDPLTGLANTLLLTSRVRHAMSEVDAGSKPLALLVLNIDRFAQLNETLGRAAGDRVLCCLAERWGAALGPQVTLARLGADGYAALIEGLASPKAAMQAGTRLREALREPIPVADPSAATPADGLADAPASPSSDQCRAPQGVSVTVSIGIALYPGQARDAEALLHQAEDAMREAKADKGNQVRFFDQRHGRATMDWFRTEGALRRAVEQNELLLLYQPQIDLANGRVLAAEALLRWRRDGLLVLPEFFIQVVEGTDLAEPISRWVLDTACRQARAWLDHQHPLRVAVNVFSGHVTGGRLVEDVRRALAESGLPAQYLELEVVESSLLADPERAAETLHALKDLGIRLALDDFGTGYSSLGYLKRYPFDVLKIDRIFTAGVNRDALDAAIVRSTISLAHNLGMQVLAEGVETSAQLRFLARYSCDQAQGFLLSHPILPERIESLAREQCDLRPAETLDDIVKGILLVEDNPIEAEILCQILDSTGARTHWARDAAEALTLVDSRHIDLIVADYYLGGTTGVEVLTTLHGLYPEIPSLMVSATEEQAVVIDAVNRAGIRGFLTKPVKPDVLVTMVHRILGRAGADSPT